MSWLQKRKSPRPSPRPSPKPGLLSSGSLEKTSDVKLQCDEGGLKNPMDWRNMPLVLKEKFPHWKESAPDIKNQSKNTLAPDVDERSIHFSSSFKAPDYTIPYMVMDNDTVNSIAIKFETTPSDIARINRKHQGFVIFAGDVLYVPDIDHMPKPAPPPPPADSPLTPSSPLVNESVRPSSIETCEGGEERVEGGLTPVNWSQGVVEEVAETHLSIVCKFMSEDQGCVHGSLVINHMNLMFTPHTSDPLVRELGKVPFEIVLPLDYVTYAALTKDVAPPIRKSSKKPAIRLPSPLEQESGNHDNHVPDGHVTSDNSVELTLSLDKVRLSEDASGKVPVIKFSKESFSEDEEGCEAGVNGEGCEAGDAGGGVSSEAGDAGGGVSSEAGDAGGGSVSSEAGEGVKATGPETQNDDTENKLFSVGSDLTSPNLTTSQVEESPSSAGEPPDNQSSEQLTNSTNEHDDPLIGVIEPTVNRTISGSSESSTDSAASKDSILSNEPVFLHVHVRPKPGLTYTYTPINNSVGIDIPRKSHGNGVRQGTRDSRSSSSVQQVKTCFCFAFAEKRANDLVGFICSHHPEPLKTVKLPFHTKNWVEGSYEFISCGEDNSTEGLDFCDDHFDTSSWEIYSLQDVAKYRSRISVMELELPLPPLSESSELMEDDHLRRLAGILPSSAVGHDWVLVYSTFRDGISLRTMYRNMVTFENEDTAVVLVVRDDQNKIFGTVTTCPLRLSEKFYGRGESSLYSFDSPTEMHHYYWTGQNYYIIKGNSTSLSIGSGDGHPGLWIDENFYHGSSYECSTFNNKCLASNQDFICTGVEAWGFL